MIRVVVPLLWLLLAGHAAGQPLRSPWAAAAGGAGSCDPAPALPRSLNVSDYYTDRAYSVADPVRQAAYEAGVRPLREATAALERMADEGPAACAAAWLRAFADGGVLTGGMATSQAEYVRAWMLGAWGVVALKSAPPGGVPGPVAAWLATLAGQVRRFNDTATGRVDRRNNHRYWAGFAVAAAGVAANRRDLFDWGLDSARVGLRQVTAEGTLPLEMARGSRALHYHLFAAAPLVLTAEIAAANGIDLFGEPGADGRPQALPRLAGRALAGVADPGWFTERAGVAQLPARGDSGSDVGWAAPVLRRFPELGPRPAAAGAAALYGGGRPPA